MRLLFRRLRAANWRYALGEVALIVVGVLIALSANAWWMGRQDRAREQLYLRQLLSDFAANDRTLAEARNAEARTTDASWRLYRATHWEAPPPDTLAAWFGASARVAAVRPVTGTLLALIQTGDINLIRSDSLRSRLVAFAGRIEQDIESLRQVEAEMHRIGAERNRLVDPREYRPTAARDGTPKRPFPARWDALLVDPAFNALTTTNWSASVRRWAILQGLLSDTRAIHALLAAELGQPLPAPFCSPPAQESAANETEYAGVYELQLSPTTVSLEDGSLRVQGIALGGSLLPAGPDAFCAPEDEAWLRFHRDDRGNVVQLTIEQWGRTFRGPRIP